MIIHCMPFLSLAALLVSSAVLCMRSALAAAASPSPLPACPPSPLIPSCPVLPFPPSDSCPPDPSLWDTTLPPFNQSCPFLLANLSSSPPFTIAFTDELPFPDPSLRFALFRSWPDHPFMEIIFNFSLPADNCAGAGSLLTICKSGIRIQIEPSADHSDREEARLFNYSGSLAYDASSGALHVQAKVNYGGGLEREETIVVNSTYLQPDPDREQDVNISLLVAFVTRGEANITISTMNEAPSSSSFSDPPPPPQNKSKSTHTMVVVWVVVGVSMLAFVVVLIIIVLTIKKHHRKRPPLVRSQLAGGEHVGPPSTTTRAPLPRPHLESSATPMMTTLCLSPPYHALSPPYPTDNFQMSGTASWLKQPNPR